MTCSCGFSEFGGLVTCNNEDLGSEIAIKTTRSSHAETVCLLSKLKSNHHIEVELKMDEMDLTSVEKKATYEEIKA